MKVSCLSDNYTKFADHHGPRNQDLCEHHGLGSHLRASQHLHILVAPIPIHLIEEPTKNSSLN
jgi:hypothetical protein